MSRIWRRATDRADDASRFRAFQACRRAVTETHEPSNRNADRSPTIDRDAAGAQPTVLQSFRHARHQPESRSDLTKPTRQRHSPGRASREQAPERQHTRRSRASAPPRGAEPLGRAIRVASRRSCAAFGARAAPRTGTRTSSRCADRVDAPSRRSRARLAPIGAESPRQPRWTAPVRLRALVPPPAAVRLDRPTRPAVVRAASPLRSSRTTARPKARRGRCAGWSRRSR